MTDDEIIAVVQAHKEGKEIQCRLKGRSDFYGWNVTSPSSTPQNPSGSTEGNRSWWNFETHDYRVAPEPRKPREWNVYVSRRGELFPSKGSIDDLEFIRVREVIE